MYVKLLGTESFCNGTANTFANSGLIRLYNPNTTTAFLITQVVNSTVNAGSITLGPLEAMVIVKPGNNSFTCNSVTNQVLAVPVAYKGGS